MFQVERHTTNLESSFFIPLVAGVSAGVVVLIIVIVVVVLVAKTR